MLIILLLTAFQCGNYKSLKLDRIFTIQYQFTSVDSEDKDLLAKEKLAWKIATVVSVDFGFEKKLSDVILNKVVSYHTVYVAGKI